MCKIDQCSEMLKCNEIEKHYKNFKSLYKLATEYTCENHSDSLDVDDKQKNDELKLKAFAKALSKHYIIELFNLLEKYYKKGLAYYITWSIIILTLIEMKNVSLNQRTIDILLDIEMNEFYGLKSLKTAVNNYWKNNSLEIIQNSSINIDEFINTYDESKNSYLCFSWNGKHAEDFKDANLNFRRSVIASVLSDITKAPLPLIRDLYLAETQYAKEAWCVHSSVSMLAESLLMRGGTSEFDNYCKGLQYGFDAFMAAMNINLSIEMKSQLVEICKHRILDQKYEKNKMLYQLLIDKFK